MDMHSVVGSWTTRANPLRLRQVDIVSVDAGATCTIDAGGTTVAGVRWASPPQPGCSAWLATDGRDGWIIATLPGQSSGCGWWGQRAAAQSLTTGSFTNVQYDSGSDPWNMVNSSFVATVPADGMWTMSGFLQHDTLTGTYRGGRILLNGATVLAQVTVAGNNGFPTRTTYAATTFLAKGDTIELEAWQNSGGNLDLTLARFGMTWVGIDASAVPPNAPG